jgi:hypothetical protein
MSDIRFREMPVVKRLALAVGLAGFMAVLPGALPPARAATQFVQMVNFAFNPRLLTNLAQDDPDISTG